MNVQPIRQKGEFNGTTRTNRINGIYIETKSNRNIEHKKNMWNHQNRWYN